MGKDKDDRKFIKNVIKLTAGNFGRYMISFLAAPIISRLYTPEDFGRFGVFVSVTTIIATGAALGYEAAIVPAQTDEEASRILTLSILILLFNSLLTGVLVYLLGLFRPELVKKYSLVLAPLAIIANGGVVILTFWNNRYEQYSRISLSRAAVPFMSSLTQIFLHFLNSLGLIIGIIWGKLFSMLILLKNLRFSRDWSAIRATAKKLYRYPTYYFGSSLLNVVSQYIPIILLEWLFSPTVSGSYTFSTRILFTPIRLIGVSFGQVFFKEVSGKDKNEMRTVTVRTAKLLMKLSIPFSLMFLFGGKALFSTIFGSNWEYAGRITQIFAPWIMIVFITSPLTLLFIVLERQKEFLIFNASLLIAMVASIAIGRLLGNSISAFVIFSVVASAIRLGLLCWVFRNLDIEGGPFSLMFLRDSALPAAIFGIFTLGYRILDFSQAIYTGLIVIGGAISYSILLWENRGQLITLSKKRRPD